MAFDLRAPVPIRFQRYITNTPVWEAGEEYFTGDVIRHFAIGETALANTLYIAIADNVMGVDDAPNVINSTFWKATSAGAVELDDIVLPAAPLSGADATAFKIAIRANFDQLIADNASDIETLEDTSLDLNFGNLPITAGGYVADLATSAESDLFRTALDVAQGTLSVQDDDVAISGGVLPTGTLSSSTISHIRVGGVLHPLGASTLDSAVFNYEFNSASAVLGSDEDDSDPDNFTAVLTVTTTNPHQFAGITAMVSADAAGSDIAFAQAPVVALDVGGLLATLTLSIPTTSIRDFNWALTISYSTGGVDQPAASSAETFMVVAAPDAGSSVSFSPASLFTGTPAGTDSMIEATYTFNGGYGATLADMAVTSVSRAVAGFDPAAVTFAPVGATLGMNEANEEIFGAFTFSVELDAIADATSNWVFPVIPVFSIAADVANSVISINGDVVISIAPPITTLYRGWTNIPHDNSGSGLTAVTITNVLTQAEVVDLDGYTALQKLTTDPEALVANDISYVIAIPAALGLDTVEAIINVGGEQAITVPFLPYLTMSVTGVPGVSSTTAYSIFMIQADGTFAAFDNDSIQTLIVR